MNFTLLDLCFQGFQLSELVYLEIVYIRGALWLLFSLWKVGRCLIDIIQTMVWLFMRERNERETESAWMCECVREHVCMNLWDYESEWVSECERESVCV